MSSPAIETRRYRRKFLLVILASCVIMGLFLAYMNTLPRGVALKGHNLTGRPIYGFWVNSFIGGPLLKPDPDAFTCCWALDRTTAARVIWSFKLLDDNHPPGLQAEVHDTEMPIPPYPPGAKYLHVVFGPDQQQVRMAWSDSLENPLGKDPSPETP